MIQCGFSCHLLPISLLHVILPSTPRKGDQCSLSSLTSIRRHNLLQRNRLAVTFTTLPTYPEFSKLTTERGCNIEHELSKTYPCGCTQDNWLRHRSSVTLRFQAKKPTIEQMLVQLPPRPAGSRTTRRPYVMILASSLTTRRQSTGHVDESTPYPKVRDLL